MGATIITGSGDTWDFDIVTGEGHQHDAEWPTSPVEDGADVSDHCHLSPEELTLDGLVTDDNEEGDLDRAKAAYEALLDIRNARELVTVVTDLRVYESMGILSVSTSVGKDTGKAVNPSVTLRQIRIVNSVSIPVPPDVLSPPVRSSGQSTVELEKQALDMEGDGTEANPFALSPPSWGPNADYTPPPEPEIGAGAEASSGGYSEQDEFEEYFW